MSLRDYQKEAIAKCREYVWRFRQDETTRAGLVHMATGTGKTGVIASLARCLPEIGTTLVLAPRIALCDQLEIEVESQFFEKLTRRPSLADIPKRVLPIEELINRGPRARLSNLVIISTIQMFESMSRAGVGGSWRSKTKHRLYERLIAETDLVLVDEGHYEPALSWSLALRKIHAPRILFTATPYRNDLKAFDVDLQFAYHFTLKKATAQNFIRRIIPIPRTSLRDPRKFVEDVLKFYDEEVHAHWPDGRVIIRCDNVTSIDHMAQVMKEKQRAFVAIHDQFDDGGVEEWKRRTVPRRDAADHERWYGKNGPVFWIHQFKLLEGIDDDRFRLVAIFEQLGNARQVVQQIGRIIRNPEFPNRSSGFLLDHSDGFHTKEWKTLFDYDDDLSKITESTPPLKQAFISGVLKAHPQRLYVNGSVRSRFDFDSFEPEGELSLPLAANFVRKTSKFDFGRLITDIQRRMDEGDRLFKRYDDPDGRTVTFIFFNVASVPFLKSSFLLSGDPGFLVVSELGQLLAFNDSEGTSPFGLHGVGKAARPSHLRKLFSDDDGSKLVEIATKNAQLGHRAVRTRGLSAASVEETVPALDDYAQVLTRASGYTTEMVWNASRGGKEQALRRRYLGFRNGRVVESGERVGIQEYKEWVREIEQVLLGNRTRLPTFARYANEIDDAPDHTPRNILLDVYEVEEFFRTLGDDEKGIKAGEPLQIEDACQSVKSKVIVKGKERKYFFTIKANGQDCEVGIGWDPKRSKYVLSSLQLDALYVSNGERGSLIGYLNREQSFRVLPKTSDVIYVDGEFYELVLPVGTKFDKDRYHVGMILTDVAKLRDLKDEKGQDCLADGSDWDADSLFGWISRGAPGSDEMKKALGSPDIVVCDDMGTEAGDFIISDSSRVVVIHVKGAGFTGKRSKFSAGKLSYVCAQATKNIRYLSMFNTQKPDNVKRWEDPWSSEATTRGVVKKRIRKPGKFKGAEDVWELLEERIRNPRTQREVWIVLGGILSKKGLEAALSQTNPRPEAIQAVTLLHGTLSTIGSIDAKLRVFCYP